ncbi:MAG: hypothetical protein BroJett011_76150 [Chloroflexota bacterium]|nr:MAG: hypothetical protein BroJett011_76150 [Chloroflexota bacterium]
MRHSKLSPKQTIVLFLAALALFATMACGAPSDDYSCPNCDITWQGGF